MFLVAPYRQIQAEDICFSVRQFLLFVDPLLFTPFVCCDDLQSASISMPFLRADCSLSGVYHPPFACLSPVHHPTLEIHLPIVRQLPAD